jgi:tetratricopeptide (TPR) repeat protein
VKNRLTKSCFVFFLPLIPVFVAGCATLSEISLRPASPPSRTAPKKDSISALPEPYRLKALEHEKKGDLPKALKNWEVVRSFLPGDAQAGEKIDQLKKQIPAAAEMHFKKGLAFFQSHSYASARKEFLLSLYLNPDHAQALLYLKQKMSGEDSVTYEVKKGDTIKEVARKIYGDPQKDFLIAYFNGLKINSSIEPPMIMKIPFWDFTPAKKRSVHSKKAVDLPPVPPIYKGEILGRAQAAYDQGNYQESAALTEKAREYDPLSHESNELRNASYYQLGKQLSQERKYEEALQAFQRVDPDYKDVGLQGAYNRKQLAEVHYIEGVKFFIAEEVEKAIKEWENTLALNPDHPKAPKDIENGRNLLKKLENIK